MKVGQEQRVLTLAPQAQRFHTIIGNFGRIAKQSELVQDDLLVDLVVLRHKDQLAPRTGLGHGRRCRLLNHWGIAIARGNELRRSPADRRGYRAQQRSPPQRVAVCFVGAEEHLFRPGWTPPGRFHALFVGKLIPLHGVETILAAARLAPEVPFRIVGSGQLDHVVATATPANVERVAWIEYDELPGAIHASGCALGVFGTSTKAQRVIPNKAFQALACGAPLVTADTPAARELLLDGESALLVPPGDPATLAATVRRLAEDDALARRIGAGGYAAYHERASEAVLGRRWRALVEGAVART